MTRDLCRRVILPLLGAALLGLAACGSPTATMPVDTRPAAVTDAAPSPAATDAASLINQYAALPQSRTPEGYYVLGEADAPIIMQHYSDFL